MTQRGRAVGRPMAAVPRAAGRPRGDLSARRARLREIIEPVVIAAGYDLEDLSVSRAGRRHVVRVVVDRDGGVNLDAVAEVSRSISAALDMAEETDGDLVAGEYQLEVSSPGVDRPLTLPRHWRRNIGRLVKVTADNRQVVGRVTDADDIGVTFDLEGRTGQWAYPDLGPGRVQVEFSRLDEMADEEFDDVGDVAEELAEEVEDAER